MTLLDEDGVARQLRTADIWLSAEIWKPYYVVRAHVITFKLEK